MKVLIAEDDPDQLSVRCMLLEQCGFEAIPAADRTTALQLVAAQKPEWAIVDLRLPTEEAGLRLISELKGLEPSIRILVLTGGTPHGFSQRPQAKLVEDVVVKGTPAANLIQKLRSLAAQAN